MLEEHAISKVAFILLTAIIVLSACDSTGQGATPAADFKYPAKAEAAVQAAKSDLINTTSASQQSIRVIDVQKKT